MPQTADESGQTTSPAESSHWPRLIQGLTYNHIPDTRTEMADFLLGHGLPQTYVDRLALSLSEILTNLIKHPLRKPHNIDVHITLTALGLVMDVADDASPFAAFDAKCKDAMSNLRSAETLSESGYGLGCILSQHSRVFYHPAGSAARTLNQFVIEDDAESIEGPRSTAERHTQKPVIFLVDDDPIALKNQHRILSAHYDVMAFSSATDALAVYKEQPPDLVISDLHMPGMNGIGLRQALLALNNGDTVPFVFISAVTSGATSSYISHIGIDDFMTKPVSAPQLLASVERLLTRRRQFHRAIEGRFHQDLTNLLRPALPDHVAGWQIVTLNRMADVGGGDFTLHHQEADHLLAVLADVMGHGATAKFFAYAYAGYLRSLFRMSARQATDAGDFLYCLSDAVADDDFLDGTLMTCQSFRLFQDGRADIASAGHPAPIFLAADGAVRTLDVAGPLPGMAGMGGYQQLTLQAKTGDRVLFATDGFFDVFDPEGYRWADLIDMLQSRPALPLAASAKDIWRIFENKSQSHARPADDATLVIAEFGGTP